MSDSGFSGPPPVTAPTPADVRNARHDVLKVVDTAGMIRNNARLQRIAGEIVAENKDGTMRIATAQGDITVQKPPRIPDMTVGAKVEMDVPAGSPPRQVTIREVTPPPPQQPARDTPAPAGRNVPARDSAPVISVPPRPPVSIPEQPPAPLPQTTPAPVTPEQIVRLLPLPPAQAAQIITPPATTIPVPLPALPPSVTVAADIIAQQAPQNLSAELMRTLLSAPAPQLQTALQQITNVILPQAPASAYVTPAPLPVGLPPAVQTAAQQLLSLTQAATPAMPSPDPLMRFMAPVGPNAASLPGLSLGLTKLPPAMAAFAALAPENLVQAPPATAPALPPAPGLIIPKMDARIIAVGQPAPLFAGTPVTDNPFMPSLSAQFPAPPATPAGMLAAQVRGITAQNFPVLSVSFPALNAVQDFVMQFPAADMIAGTPVTVQPQPGTALPVQAAAALAPFTPLPELMVTGLWPALDDAFQALQAAAPQAAQIMAQTAIPHPGSAAAAPRMPAVIMMFVAAMQGGDLQGWLGEKTIDSLRRIGKADIISRINRDGAAIGRLTAADTPGAAPQDWRSLPVPMMWDNHVHKIMLHYRHDRETSKDGAEKKKGTRFILDLTPPRMGAVQLDGLHRPGDANGRLDLIVRTGENLSPHMQQAMRRLYVNALEQAHLSGELSFQNKGGAWVNL